MDQRLRLAEQNVRLLIARLDLVMNEIFVGLDRIVLRQATAWHRHRIREQQTATVAPPDGALHTFSRAMSGAASASEFCCRGKLANRASLLEPLVFGAAHPTLDFISIGSVAFPVSRRR